MVATVIIGGRRCGPPIGSYTNTTPPSTSRRWIAKGHGFGSMLWALRRLCLLIVWMATSTIAFAPTTPAPVGPSGYGQQERQRQQYRNHFPSLGGWNTQKPTTFHPPPSVVRVRRPSRSTFSLRLLFSSWYNGGSNEPPYNRNQSNDKTNNNGNIFSFNKNQRNSFDDPADEIAAILCQATVQDPRSGRPCGAMEGMPLRPPTPSYYSSNPISLQGGGGSTSSSYYTATTTNPTTRSTNNNNINGNGDPDFSSYASSFSSSFLLPPSSLQPNDAVMRSTNVAAGGYGAKSLLILCPHWGDVDALEYGELLAAVLPQLTRAQIYVRLIGIGTRASTYRFAQATGLPLDVLRYDARANLHRALNLHRLTLPPSLPFWNNKRDKNNNDNHKNNWWNPITETTSSTWNGSSSSASSSGSSSSGTILDRMERRRRQTLWTYLTMMFLDGKSGLKLDTLREVFRSLVGDETAPERLPRNEVVQIQDWLQILGTSEFRLSVPTDQWKKRFQNSINNVGGNRNGNGYYDNDDDIDVDDGYPDNFNNYNDQYTKEGAPSWMGSFAWQSERGYQRPLELATVRLRHWMEFWNHFADYDLAPDNYNNNNGQAQDSNHNGEYEETTNHNNLVVGGTNERNVEDYIKSLITWRGCTFLLEARDETGWSGAAGSSSSSSNSACRILHQHRANGLFLYSATPARPLAFLEPYIGTTKAYNPLGMLDDAASAWQQQQQPRREQGPTASQEKLRRQRPLQQEQRQRPPLQQWPQPPPQVREWSAQEQPSQGGRQSQRRPTQQQEQAWPRRRQPTQQEQASPRPQSSSHSRGRRRPSGSNQRKWEDEDEPPRLRHVRRRW